MSVASTGSGAPRPTPLEVAVFLHAKVTEEQRRAVLRAIQSTPYAPDPIFISHADAYAEFSRMLNGAPVPVEPGDLPESFRFIVPDALAFPPVRSALRQMPGVHAVECRLPGNAG